MTRKKRDVKIVVGDMNAQVGRVEMYSSVIGRNNLHAVLNDNGQRCVNFAACRGMVARSTFFPRKNIHKVTWRSPDQQAESQIDHVLIDGKFFSDITNVRTYRSANIDSDHYAPKFLKCFQHAKNQQNKLLNVSNIFAELQHNFADQLSTLLDGSAS